ncbi:hypothetical protein [Brumimicrobium oceani]|uniref:hypothetical protein n=1 Tax=Brumimicrobium oceani TaxID=2100725 RepID=UPI0018EE9F77|nr:hypothetical protein [Brumimicrobium oceani]
MKHIILTLGIFSIGLLASCDNATESATDATDTIENNEHPTGEEHPSGDEHPAGEEHPAAADHEHSHDDGEEISLNDGERWKVNEEMKPFVMQGEIFVKDFLDSGDEDYLSLAENLADQNKQLITSCTMDGVSHDELHKWLHPHLELTKELKQAKSIDEANHIVEHLLASYEEYHKFFK